MAGQITKGGPNSGPPAPPKRSRWLTRLIQAAVFLPFVMLLATAVWFRFGGGIRVAILLLIVAVSAVLLRLWWMGRGRSVWLGALALFAVSALWWSSIHPSNEGDWQPDVEHGVTAEIDGNSVTLHNVRNFDWVSDTDFAPPARWETRSYRLDQLNEVDLFTSVWGNPNIAHVMVGFGFENGDHVVFSAETRKRVGQDYSTLGGFFRLYTLVLIAADERDVIRWRTDVRANPQEIVSIFPLQMRPDGRRALFLDYINMGNRLAESPSFITPPPRIARPCRGSWHAFLIPVCRSTGAFCCRRTFRTISTGSA